MQAICLLFGTKTLYQFNVKVTILTDSLAFLNIDSARAFVCIRANIAAEGQDMCALYFCREVQLQDNAV